MSAKVSLSVSFLDEHGESIRGRLLRLNKHGAIVQAQKDRRQVPKGHRGNVVLMSDINGDLSVSMAWVRIAGHANDNLSMRFLEMDQRSREELESLLLFLRDHKLAKAA